MEKVGVSGHAEGQFQGQDLNSRILAPGVQALNHGF